jgi:N-succinyldiaminopimelate aminotransferase
MTQVSGSWRRAAAGARLLGAGGEVAPTIFAEMSALAGRTGAINLGQGFPDEDGPTEVLEAARRAIAEGHNQYPPGRGTMDLRNIRSASTVFRGTRRTRSSSPPARRRR